MQEKNHLLPSAYNSSADVIHVFVSAAVLRAITSNAYKGSLSDAGATPARQVQSASDQTATLRSEAEDGQNEPENASAQSGWRRLSVVVGRGGSLLYFSHTPMGLAVRTLGYVPVVPHLDFPKQLFHC